MCILRTYYKRRERIPVCICLIHVYYNYDLLIHVQCKDGVYLGTFIHVYMYILPNRMYLLQTVICLKMMKTTPHTAPRPLAGHHLVSDRFNASLRPVRREMDGQD